MAERLKGKIAFASGKTGDYDIWSLNLESGELKQLTFGKCWNDKPSWSPDGAWVAFVSNRSGFPEIYKVPAQGGDPSQLTELGRWTDSPRFSPDGSQIAYTSNEAGNNDIWVMEADGKNKKQVTTHSGSDTYVAWTCDGKALLWSSDRDENDADIWRMDLATGDKKQLTTDWGFDISPVPSPNGDLVAFVSNRPLDPNEKRPTRDMDKDIWIMASDGELQLGITSNQGADYGPCWSPDGRYILYAASNTRKSGHLRLIDMTALASAYQTRDVDAITDVAVKIRSEKLDLDRDALKTEIGAERKTSFLTFFLPDGWVSSLYPADYFGQERYPDWIN